MFRECAQKNICVIRLNDGDMVDDLLQISNLTLAATITKFQGWEAAKRHGSSKLAQDVDIVVALCRSYQTSHQVPEESGLDIDYKLLHI